MRKAKVARIDETIEYIDCYTVDEFPFEKLDTKVLNVRTKKKSYKQIVYDFATFDIETTSIVEDDKPIGFMYHWQWCQGDNLVCYGRTWEELIKFLQRLCEIYQLSPERHLIIYIHNLAFEFQFIKDFLTEYFGGFKVFARARRKPIRVTTPAGLEFRCSYILTNMSLKNACLSEYGQTYCKADGDLDYRIIRTAKTPIDDTEFGYCISDVVCLHDLISRKLINDKDNLEYIPLTSTGYVRREVRNPLKEDSKYHDFIKTLALTPKVLQMLYDAGRGGDTHTNRFMSGRVWQDVDSDDAVSSYPYQITTQLYPMTKLEPYGDIESIEEFNNLIDSKACLFYATFTDLKLKDNEPMPYIPISKCLFHSKERLDNGRVLQAESIKICLTDIDFKIIKNEYSWEGFYIEDMHTAEYGYLPEEIRKPVLDYFVQKCELKSKIKKEKDKKVLKFLKYLYAKAKNRLNSIFGMMYTNPINNEITIDSITGEWKEEPPKDIEKELEHHNNSWNTFLYYAWGVWTTARAREHLKKLQKATNTEGNACIYCDTDSSKWVGGNKEPIERLNHDIIKLCEERGAYCDVDGERFYLGIFEHETDKPYQNFKSLGAKKYAYTDANGEFHITISGVEKEKGAKEMSCIENFNVGFIFKDAGGLTLYYNDEKNHQITINGVTFTTASNISMQDSTYELGVTDEYAEIIGLNIFKDIDNCNTL